MSFNIQSTFSAEQGAIRCVRFNKSGDYCLTGGADKSIKLWKPSTALCLNSYKAHSGDILDLMASSDNSNIISASSDCKGYLWDVATCKVLRKFMPNNGPLNAIKFNKYDSLVFTGSTDSKVKIYDIKGSLKDPIMILADSADSITSLDIGESKLVCSTAHGQIITYDLRNNSVHLDCVSLGPIYCAKILNSDNFAIITSDKNSLRMFNLEDGSQTKKFQSKQSFGSFKVECALDSSQMNVYVGSQDGKIYSFDVLTGELNARITINRTMLINSVDVCGDDKLIASSGKDLFYFSK